MIKINGVELDFDFMDIDDKECFNDYFSDADDEIQELIEETKNQKDDTVFARKYCEIVIRLFENLFGEDETHQIFEGKTNIRKCASALRDIVKEAKKQKNELDDILQEITDLTSENQKDDNEKYNREQRRARKNYKN